MMNTHLSALSHPVPNFFNACELVRPKIRTFIQCQVQIPKTARIMWMIDEWRKNDDYETVDKGKKDKRIAMLAPSVHS